METLFQDLRFGVRSLLKTPQLTFAALACIAIGVAATMSVVTMIDAILIRQVPFPEADRLVRVWATVPGELPREDLSYADYRDIREQAESFEALEAAMRTRLAVTTPEGTERMRGEAVSPGYFDLIGVKAVRGRLFTAEEYEARAQRVMVIGDYFWKTTFGGDPEVLGKTINARSVYDPPGAPTLPYTIVGVLPPGFIGTVEEDTSRFWIPIEHYPPRRSLENRDDDLVWTMGRLAPGVTVEEANAEVETIGRQLAAAYPNRANDFGARVEAFGENWRSEIRRGLYLLMAASVLLLLIACTNIANLLLARLAKREHELGLRMVLGARRPRIIRQLLTESLTLATIGGLAGVLLAYWGIQAFIKVVGFDLPEYVEISLDWRLVVATLVVILATGIGFGVLPALFGARLNLASQMREAGRGTMGSRRQALLGQLLVVAEVALTFMLLVGAGLMLGSYNRLVQVDLGYRVDRLLRMGITLNMGDMPEPQQWMRFMPEAREAISNQPGVRQATVAVGVLPPWSGREGDVLLVDSGDVVRVMQVPIDSTFLDTLGIELLHGRDVRDIDTYQTARVVLVSRSLARLLSPDGIEEAADRQLRFVVDAEGNTSQPYTIAGVVEDVMWLGPQRARADRYNVYLVAQQVPGPVLSIAIHTDVEPETLINPIRRELGKLAPTSPVHWISTMEGELANQYSDSRFYAFLFSVYSASAVVLAIIGIYGVLSNSVIRRFNEIGVRAAFGASRGDVLRLELGRGLRLAVLGVAVGVVGAVASASLMESLLYGVAARDPATFVQVAVGLTLLALVACFFPASRAMKVNPVEALRQE
jgi:predicted permease